MDIRRRKVSWMATSAGSEPWPPYSNCRGQGEQRVSDCPGASSPGLPAGLLGEHCDRPCAGVAALAHGHSMSEPVSLAPAPASQPGSVCHTQQRSRAPRTFPHSPSEPSCESGSGVQLTHLGPAGHALAEPDVLLLLGVLADVPVLLGHAGLSGVHARLTSLHVAEDLDGVQVAALVGVDPVFSCDGAGPGGQGRPGRWGARG